ncbi:MAG: hypothetical protein RQ875_08060 [Vicingaceae bacterium]|nr:hypothetical protein [Vicingaceae bacterium]
MKNLSLMCEGYYDFTSENNQYKYIDGNHLHKASGKEFTKKIGELILHKD